MHALLLPKILSLATLLATATGCGGLLATTSQQSYTDGQDLGMSMMGSIANTDPQKSVGLVKETASGKIQAVRAGHKLGEYTVQEITYRYMIISKGTQSYLVYQSKFAGDFSRAAADGPPPSNAAALVAPGTDSYSEDGFERSRGKVRVTAAYRNKLISQDLSKVLMQATAIPAIDNGEVVGFKLLQIDADSIYAKAGFLDHDVITSINGQALNSAASAVRLLQSLRGESDIEVEYLRGGVKQKISMRVEN